MDLGSDDGQFIPDTEIPSSYSGLQKMLMYCFDPEMVRRHGAQKNGIFTVKTIDDFRDVMISFEVTSHAPGESCTLKWLVGVEPTYNRGSYRSVRVGTNERIQPLYPFQDINSIQTAAKQTSLPTGIEIALVGGEEPHISLEDMHPNNQASGKMIRSLVVQITDAYETMFQKKMYTSLEDSSLIRELYWLEHRGKTYYESVWNLEYTCLKEALGEHGLSDFHESVSQLFDQETCRTAFNSNQNLIFQPEPTLDNTSPEFVFGLAFQGKIFHYRISKVPNTVYDLTLRQALEEFISRWKNEPNYSVLNKRFMAQRTLIYFFRDKGWWPYIARQALSGYAEDCKDMKGYPKDLSPRQFEFSYTPRIAVSPSINQQAIRVAPDSDEHEISTTQPFQHSFFTYFIFLFILIIAANRLPHSTDNQIHKSTTLNIVDHNTSLL